MVPLGIKPISPTDGDGLRGAGGRSQAGGGRADGCADPVQAAGLQSAKRRRRQSPQRLIPKSLELLVRRKARCIVPHRDAAVAGGRLRPGMRPSRNRQPFGEVTPA